MAITKVSRGLLNTGVSDSSDATAITIDSSENVMVGATSYNNDNAGIGLGSSGFLYATRDGSIAASFNRLSSDGTVVDFRNDSTVVGGIGVASSDLTFETNSTERMRIDSSGKIGIGTTSPNYRLEVSAEAAVEGDVRIIAGNRDKFIGGALNNIELGTYSSNNTARNVHMSIDSAGDAAFSGSIKLNGDTAAANSLDDYEEGSWTPTNASVSGNMTAYSCRYTKIGNLVSIRFDILNNSGNGALLIGGLPFTVKSGAHGGVQIVYHNYSASHSGFSTGYCNANDTFIRLTVDGSTGGWTLANGYRIIGFGAYETDS